MSICSSGLPAAAAGGTPGGSGEPAELTTIHLQPTGQPEVFETNANAVGAISQAVAVLSTVAGEVVDFSLEFPCQISRVVVLATPSGDLELDIWKTPLASFGAISGAQTICAAARPTLVSTSSYSDATLSGWTTTVQAGECLRVVCVSASGPDKATLVLKVRRTSG